jgi:phosphatidylserine decarboxylase
MAKTLDQWIATDVAKAEKLGIDKLSTEFFFRDPPRPNYIDHEHFYSPADGVILYQKFIKDPSQPVVEIKGMNYTLQDVMGDPDYNKPSLVIGVFMSFYDVHINRVPYGGIIRYKRLEPIESTNKPMLAIEKDILNKTINPDNLEYLKYNERMLNEFYIPSLDYKYYVLQIADEDVNVIAPFHEQITPLVQNERFSLIRWGSQCDLVLPLDDRFNFEICQDDHVHCEAGIDQLVKVTFN